VQRSIRPDHNPDDGVIRTMATRQNNTRDGALPAASLSLSDVQVPEAASAIDVSVALLDLLAEQAAGLVEHEDRQRRFPLNRDYAIVASGGCGPGESFTVPPTDGRIRNSREKHLADRGWTLLPVPKFVRRTSNSRRFDSPLAWDGPSWLVTPPEGSELAARTFPKKGLALTWAEARA
jgi:hypothetical protein